MCRAVSVQCLGSAGAVVRNGWDPLDSDGDGCAASQCRQGDGGQRHEDLGIKSVAKSDDEYVDEEHLLGLFSALAEGMLVEHVRLLAEYVRNVYPSVPLPVDMG